MRYLTTSIAALALAASGALAQGQGKGNGNDHKGHGGGPPAAAQAGPKDKPDRGPERMSERRGPDRPERADNRGRGQDRDVERGGPPARAERMERRDDREDRIERRDDREFRSRRDRDRDFDDDLEFHDDRDFAFFDRDRSRGLVAGCPPGLAKKNNGCMPPGQARQQRSLFGYGYSPSLFGLSSYGDGRYYYDDGYLMRLGDSGISGYIPLLGGALSVGNVWPSGYQGYAVPDYYSDYYNLGGPYSYRYADNVVYRLDPETSAIQSIAALLTGDDFVVGQPMPMGYDVYNVPYPYRDRYYDTPQANYRYSDGYVYRVDPETQIVAAVIDLLV